MYIGNIEIKKAYLGNRELTPDNAYLGSHRLIDIDTQHGRVRYTTVDGNKLNMKQDGWGSSIIGQYKKDGVWTVYFDGEVEKIPNEAFKDMKKMSSLTIPSTIKEIGGSILKGVNNVNTIIFDGPYNKWMDIQKDKAWNNGSVITVISTHNGDIAQYMDRISYTTTDNSGILPHNTYGYKIKSRNFTNGQGTIIFDKTFWKVGDTPASFFYNKPTLKSIVLPSYMGRVHNNIFTGCINLERVTLPKNILYMENSLFNGCCKLTELYYLGTKCDWSTLVDNSKNWNYNSSLKVVHCLDGDITNVVDRYQCKGISPVPPHPDPKPSGDCPCVEISGDDFIEYIH